MKEISIIMKNNNNQYYINNVYVVSKINGINENNDNNIMAKIIIRKKWRNRKWKWRKMKAKMKRENENESVIMKERNEMAAASV